MTSALNTEDAAKKVATNAALAGVDSVMASMKGQLGQSAAVSGAGMASSAVAGADPTLGYVQAGAAALQAVSQMTQNPPQTTTAAYYKAPVNITYGGGQITSNNSPSNTPSISSGQSAGGITDALKYVIIGVVAIIAVKSLRKAA